MPRVTELTDELVHPHIAALLTAGQYPTAARLRERLGGKGSPVVLQRFLTEWYAAHGAAFAEKSQAHRPAVTVGGLRASLAAATREALQDFEAQQAARVAALDDREATLSAREAALAEHERRLDDRELGTGELIAELRAQIATLTAARETDQAERTRLHAELASAAERARLQAVAVEQGVQDAKALATLRAELATARTKLAAAEDVIVECAGERDAARQALGRRDTALQGLTAERDRLQAALTDTRVELARAREGLDAARAGREAAEAQIAALQARGDTLAAQLATVSDERVAWQARYETVAAERDRLVGTILARLEQAAAPSPAPARVRKAAKPRPRS